MLSYIPLIQILYFLTYNLIKFLFHFKVIVRILMFYVRKMTKAPIIALQPLRLLSISRY